MAINPSIPLQVNTNLPLQVEPPRIGQTILDLKDREMRNNLVGLQTRKAKGELDEYERNAPTRALQNVNERQQARLKSMTFRAAGLKPYLDAGDIEGAQSFLSQSKASLDQLGIDSSDTQKIIELLNRDPAAVKKNADQAYQFGQQMGWLKQQDEGRGDYFTYKEDPELGIVAADARSPRLIDPVTKKEITTRVRSVQQDPQRQAEIASAKELGKTVGEAVGTVGGKYDAIESVREAKDILNEGIYSGYFAEIQKSAAKATPGIDKTKAANTEKFISYIGNVVVPRLKEFGGNDSNEEMRYLQRIMGGDIQMEETALKAILESVERKINAGIKRLREQASSVGAKVPENSAQPEQNDPLGIRK